MPWRWQKVFLYYKVSRVSNLHHHKRWWYRQRFLSNIAEQKFLPMRILTVHGSHFCRTFACRCFNAEGMNYNRVWLLSQSHILISHAGVWSQTRQSLYNGNQTANKLLMYFLIHTYHRKIPPRFINNRIHRTKIWLSNRIHDLIG